MKDPCENCLVDIVCVDACPKFTNYVIEYPLSEITKRWACTDIIFKRIMSSVIKAIERLKK